MLSNLYSYLSGRTGITALVSSRIYPHHLPQSVSTFPVLTFQQISNNHLHHLDSAAGVTVARVQVDCWGNTLSSVESLGEAVRAALQGYMGVMGTTVIHFVQLDSEQDLHELGLEGSDEWIYRRSQDYLIKYVVQV